MPIYSLEGTPGSGKTLYCVQKIIPDFLKIRDSAGNLVPRHIYTNIEGLRPEMICQFLDIPYHAIHEYFHRLGEKINDDGTITEDKDLIRYWYFKPESIEWVVEQNGNRQPEKHPDWEKAELIPLGSMIIIDEIQNYYSNRDFATIYSKKAIDYITKNRHYGWSLWWMSQSVESVDVSFRRNTQYVYFLERKEIFGSSNSASVKMYEGWLAGDKTNTPPFAVKTFNYDKKFYQCYNSYVTKNIKEKRYSTNVFLNHKGLMIMVILALICIIYLLTHNPLDTISGKKNKPIANKFVAKAETATPQSSSGAGAVEAPRNDVICIENEYINSGIPYVVINGKSVVKIAGVDYDICR